MLMCSGLIGADACGVDARVGGDGKNESVLVPFTSLTASSASSASA